MPTLDASQNLLAASADYAAGDWASVGAEASLDFRATADLNRGIDIGLGVEAIAALDASVRKFLAADVNGQAHAAARVRAQVQVPLDLFDEAGLAVRLQAVAEVAVGVNLAVGLSVGDFLELAARDPRLRGVPLKLLEIFLGELGIQGGVMAKASLAAMAYANLVLTGSLVPRGGQQPGFTIAAEAGAGLKAGAGFRVLARFGVDDPRRLIRRTVDVAVEETIAAILEHVPAEAAHIVTELATPAKIALRTAFELGAALAEGGGSFEPGRQGQLALRCVQVGLEEMQRFVLGRAVEFASEALRNALRELPFDENAWSAAVAERQALAQTLGALPDDPFEASDANRAYWSAVVGDTVSLVTALAGSGAPPAEVAEPLALLWGAAQLLMRAVERISVADARASVLGMSPVTASAAFEGDLPTAPNVVREHMNGALGQAAADAIGQADVIAYLLHVTAYRLSEISPEAAALLPLLTGRSDAPASEALSIVLSNLGAFAPGPDGELDASASLSVLRHALETYVELRVDGELRPLVAETTADLPELFVFLDEVLLSTLKTVVRTVFDTLEGWPSTGPEVQRALRELCSGLLMRLFGRTLVVTGDVLLARTQGELGDALRDLAANAGRPGGVVPTLAAMTGLDPDLLGEIIEETLEVSAEAFGPMPENRRARMRDLLYQVIDTMPPDADASLLDSLASSAMVPNAGAAVELTQLLGEEIVGNVVRFVRGLLERVATALLELLHDTLEDIQKAIEQWMGDLEAFGQQLLAQLGQLLLEIGQLQQQLDDQVDAFLDDAAGILGDFANLATNHDALRSRAAELIVGQALGVLAGNPLYGLLGEAERKIVRDALAGAVELVVDVTLLDPVLDVLAALSAGTAELLDDLRAIEPGDDLGLAIAKIALDRIEDALRAAFGGNPAIPIRFEVPFLGTFDLGVVTIPIGDLVSTVRSGIREMEAFQSAVASTTGSLLGLWAAESALDAADAERVATTAVKDEADGLIAETRDVALDFTIESPEASAYEGVVRIRIRVPGGSPALVSDDGLSERRFFVWVNEHEVTLSDSDVRSEIPTIASAEREMFAFGDAGGSPASRIAPAGQRRSGALAERRDARHRGSGRERPGAAAGLSGGGSTAGVLRHAGRAVAVGVDRTVSRDSVVRGPASGPSLPLLSRDLVVELEVDASLLHEGINAVACSLMPGSAAQRIDRSVSFLWNPAPVEAPQSGRILRPPPVTGSKLPDRLRAVLDAQGVDHPAPEREPSTRREARSVRAGTWVASGREQQRVLEEARSRRRAALADAATERQALRKAVADHALRPVLPDALEALRRRETSS